MKKIYFILLFLVIGTLTFTTSCAKRGTINGGTKDTIPPKIISSSPKNFSTNFSGNEIKINFNELIKVKDINKQLIISPPFEKQPIIIPQGSASKFISVKILDTLKPNTTYSFNFGQSITDNNEGNPYSQFKYVFSTGTYIDSLTLAGKIKDAFEQKPDNFVSIQLYDATTFKDSTIYTETPLYVANTLDSLKVFALENLRAGDYKLIALKDKNNNYKYDPKSDKIGFLEQTISLPTDTVFELELFREKPKFKADKPIQQSNNKFYMGFQGNPKDTKITAKMGAENIPFKMTKFPDKGKDSLQLFLPITKPDSLVITVENGDYTKSFKTKIKEIKETDSLQIDALQKSSLNFRDQFTLTTKTPLNNIDKEKIKLIDKDSVAVDFKFTYNEFEQEITFDFKKAENQKYRLEILPDAIVDFYNTKNDTLNFGFSTRAIADYGNLKIMVKNAKSYPMVIEILKGKGEIVASSSIEKEDWIYFDAIEPNIYTLRVFYDDNKNGIWDTGDYLEKKQAEQIIYYPKGVDVRANWDVEQIFDLNE